MAEVNQPLHLDNDGVFRTTMTQLYTGIVTPIAFVEGLPWEPMYSEGVVPLRHEEGAEDHRHDPPPPLEDHGHHGGDDDKPEHHQPIPEPGYSGVLGLSLAALVGHRKLRNK